MSQNRLARTYDGIAEIYEEARPGWPMAAVEHVARELELTAAARGLTLT